jgi:putative redox protein
MESTVTWKTGMSFNSVQDGHDIILDLPTDLGGTDQGPKPKTLLLTALGGCTAMDVVSILNKMRVEFTGLTIHASGELTDEHPKVFKHLRIKYIFKGNALPQEKLEKAVSLSQEKYCGVSAMLAKACPIKYEIIIEE